MTKTYKEMRLVVADDKPNMLRTVANMLRLLGFEKVSRAENGEKALILIRTEKPDLVLCDWNMPRMTGVEVLRAVREDDQLKNTPFIMVTGEIDAGTVAEAGEVEVDAYLLKPYTHEDLKNKIDETLEKKKEPSPIDMHLSVANVYMEAKQYEMALDELKKAAKVNPRTPRVSYALGKLYEEQKDLENARSFYERSVEFGKYFVKGHEAMSRVCMALGDLEAASRHLKEAVRISPKNLERQLTLGAVLVKQGDKQEIQKVMNNVLKIAGSKQAEVIRQVGETYLAAGMADKAQLAFSKALEADPTAIHIYNRMGIALRRQKKYLEALDTYKKAIQISPDDENLYYNLSRAYYEAGDKERSIAAMKKALSIFPDFKEAKDFLQKIGAA